MHFDMSLVSRWKSGQRKLVNRDYCHQVVEFFYNYGDKKFEPILKELVNSHGTNKEDAIIEELIEWLIEPFVEDDMTQFLMGQTPNKQTYFKSYLGNTGRRDAVIEFLIKAIAMNNPRKIYLISNEEMSWMSEDKEFLNKWSSLLSQCIGLGYELYIVHTIKRSMNELYNAFIQWVPFYMTGRVNAYYLTGGTSNQRIQTLFIIEDLLLCEGNINKRGISERYTSLTNDMYTIQTRQKDYQILLESGTKLNNNYNVTLMPTIMKSIVAAGKNKEDSLFKAEELFMSTMERSLLVEILKENEVNSELTGFALEFYDKLSGNFAQNVPLFMNRHIYNLDKLKDQAESDRFKSVLLSIVTGKEIFIKRHQYIRHIRSTVERLRFNNNFEIGLYQTSNTTLPLEEIDFWVKEGHFLTMWSKKSYDFIQLSTEPTMIETIKRFYQKLWEMIPLIDKDKNHVIEHLEKLLLIAESY